MQTIAGTARFVSDLHLRAERPDLTQRFAVFLADTAAANVEVLYILGDLFEYWIGDDDLTDPFNEEVCNLLRSARDMGPRLCFIAGNRDFLIGADFAAAAGIEFAAGNADSRRWRHGDAADDTAYTVCTDDLHYQEFRRMVRGREWQAEFSCAAADLNAAPKLKACVAAAPRPCRAKTAAIMDANAGAIRAALAAHGCSRLIHGHTHRPSHEQFRLASGDAERWVLYRLGYGARRRA